MRGVSTVLDVALFLLLVSVAVATLTVPAVDHPDATADETAETLATTTGNVSYAPVGSDGDSLDPSRTAAGTHAELLARGALANLHLDGSPLAPSTSGFRAAVHEEAATVLAWSTDRTSVVATWEPYPGAPLRGRVAVGPQPPATVDVSTATLSVPVPIDQVSARATAARDGYSGVARAVASPLLDSALGPEDAKPPDAGSPARRDWNRRIRAYAAAVDVTEPADGWAAARPTLERRLVDRLATDLRSRYDSPAAAAADVRTGQVHVVVREWSP